MSSRGNGKPSLTELREQIAAVDAKLGELESEVIEARHTKRRTAQSSPVDWHKADGREREAKAECERLNDVRVELEADLVEAELVEEAKRRKGLAEEVMAIARDMKQSQLPVHLASVIAEIENVIDDLARVRLLVGAGPGFDSARPIVDGMRPTWSSRGRRRARAAPSGSRPRIPSRRARGRRHRVSRSRTRLRPGSRTAALIPPSRFAGTIRRSACTTTPRMLLRPSTR